MTALLPLTEQSPDGVLTIDYGDDRGMNAKRNELLMAGWTLELTRKGAYRSRWRSPGGYCTSYLSHYGALLQAHGLLEQGIMK